MNHPHFDPTLCQRIGCQDPAICRRGQCHIHGALVTKWHSDEVFRNRRLQAALVKHIEAVKPRTLLLPGKLACLGHLVRSVEHLRGDMAELGVYCGGTAKLFALLAPERCLHLYDTFEGIPEDDQEPAGHKKGEFAADLEDVQNYLSGENVVFHPGTFPDTAVNGQFAFVHVDADTYQSTKAAIEWFWPRMTPGGILAFDDYDGENCPGVKRAIEEKLGGIDVQVNPDEPQAWVVKPLPPVPHRITSAASPVNLWLKNHLPPGDIFVDTCAVASLHKTYPGEYRVNVDTTWNDVIWRGNPHIDRSLRREDCIQGEFHYDAIHEVGDRDVSFMQATVENLAKFIGRPLKLEVTKPQLYLSDEERNQRLRGLENIGPYVVLNAGYKHDYPAKFAGRHIWQEVVDALKHRVAFIQVGEVVRDGRHYHKPINGAHNWIGRTTPREMFQLVHHSRAGLGPVSMLLHLSAGLDRPYICTGGGREEQSWIAYNSTIYLHTLGMLDCCRTKGCWSTLVEADPARPHDKLCALPVVQPDGQVVPKCMQLLGSESIIRVLTTILDGSEATTITPAKYCAHELEVVSACPLGYEKWHVRKCSKHGNCIREKGRLVAAHLCEKVSSSPLPPHDSPIR